jgi:CheY-like chemotaxis protein/anti-sigma regulatory factor (Ser/Thr protein kinase)
MMELASVFRSTIERAGLTFSVHCEPFNKLINIDREMWEKIIFNLLSNAFKFTFEGEIELTVKIVENQILILVRDTGIGIDAKELPHVFERFHRIEGVKSRTHEGSGIGLALVRELVEMHEGKIEVNSTLDQGTVFKIFIPLKTIKNQKENIEITSYKLIHGSTFVDEATRWLPIKRDEIAISSSLKKNAHSARILIVEDNTDMREYLIRLLNEKWQVESAANGYVALSMLHEIKFDLVLTDVMMPIADGFHLLKEIRLDSKLHNIPIIMLSARAGIETKIEGLDAGADDYLIKPFSAKEVIARVEAHLKLAFRHHLVAENKILRREKKKLRKIIVPKIYF